MSLNGMDEFYTVSISFGSYLLCDTSVLSGFVKIGEFVVLCILCPVFSEFVIMSTKFCGLILSFVNNGIVTSVICLWEQFLFALSSLTV